jgi:hypothetical protein
VPHNQALGDGHTFHHVPHLCIHPRSSPEGQALTVQYLLTIDALNFCFWPGRLSAQVVSDEVACCWQTAGMLHSTHPGNACVPVGCMLYAEEGLEYEHLSKGVKVGGVKGGWQVP